MRQPTYSTLSFAVVAVVGFGISAGFLKASQADTPPPVPVRATGVRPDSTGEKKESSDAAFFDRLEWRGIFSVGDSPEFSLYDPAEKRGFWISRKNRREGIEIIVHNEEEKTLTLRLRGRTRKLALAGGGAGVMAPSVRLTPAKPGEANAANDEAGPDSPIASLIPPSEDDPAASQAGGSMEEASTLQLVPVSEDDEMVRRTDDPDDRS